MQTVTSQFTDYAHGSVRPLSWDLLISFDKVFDDNVEFFTLDQSLLDGPDVLAPNDTNVIQQWDKYSYASYKSRVLSLEVTREETEPYSIVQAYADITLNNFDDHFTPNSGSIIDQFILPKRPVKILMGFGGENVQVFVGLTESMPKIDKRNKTASFHLVDFLTFLFDQEISETVMLQNNSTAEILDTIFTQLGLTSAQYDLDNAFNRVPFFYVQKGRKVGQIIKDLMVAEQGRLYMDELGVIRFKNRQEYNTLPVESFYPANTINYETSDEDDIINFARINSNVLEAQEEQSIWELAEPVLVKDGATAVLWASLDAPAISVTTPVYSATKVPSSHFRTSTDINGELPYTSITISDIDVFSEAVKFTFTNSGSQNAYVYALDLWGQPVRVVDTITVEDFDQASIDNFEERVFEIDTDYIQDVANAESKAAILVDDYKDFGSIVELDVKGNPALQIGDALTLGLDGYAGTYIVTRMQNIMASGRYQQRLTAKQKDPRQYFILDISVLNGSDQLAP